MRTLGRVFEKPAKTGLSENPVLVTAQIGLSKNPILRSLSQVRVISKPALCHWRGHVGFRIPRVRARPALRPVGLKRRARPAFLFLSGLFQNPLNLPIRVAYGDKGVLRKGQLVPAGENR